MKFFTLLWKKTATQKTFCIAVISKMRYQENYSLLFLVGAHLCFGWMSSSVYRAKLVEMFQDLAKMLFALCIFDVLKEDTMVFWVKEQSCLVSWHHERWDNAQFQAQVVIKNLLTLLVELFHPQKLLTPSLETCHFTNDDLPEKGAEVDICVGGINQSMLGFWCQYR